MRRRIALLRGVSLAAETGVGLPRSNLVKPKSTAALEVATTQPQLESPFAVPSPATAASGSVDVMVGDPFATTQSDVQAVDAGAPVDDHAPSTHDLLERAARLGPPRPTLESIVLPNDPILLEKMTPVAAQRRARFRKIVKATLGACVVVCLAAIGASALSPSEASASEGSAMAARTAPSRPLTSIEKLDDAKRGKAMTSHVVTANAVKAKIGKRR